MANDFINISLDRSELAKLDNLTREMEQATGAESTKVIRNVARDFCRIAQKNTPIAPRNAVAYRPIIDQKGRKRYIKAKGKVVRGMAKGGWSYPLNKLGVKRRRVSRGGWAEKHGGDYHKKQIGKDTEYMVANIVPFIEDLDNGNYVNGKPAHIMDKSLRELNITMERRLSKMAQRILNKGILG